MNGVASLYDRLRERQVLIKAWRVIRQNSRRSGSRQSRIAADEFEEHLLANIQNIQRRLRNRSYKFAPAIGVAASKGPGKTGKRAIVIAPVSDRVLQRAILDVIHKYCPPGALRDAIETPTSVGGVPGRGIGHALAHIERSEVRGATHGVRSDISNFFPSFPKRAVFDFVREQIGDEEFAELFERAITVDLANKSSLGDDINLFPLGDDGVAQGSPLSVLAGNIVLRNFDAELNKRGIVGIRYIDDFLILAPTGKAARKAFVAATSSLATLGLTAYEPGDGSGKAWSGPLTEGFDFLGYSVVRGLNPPSEHSRRRLLDRVAEEIEEGKKQIIRVLRSGQPVTKKMQCYTQTLAQIDDLLRGWSGAFQHTKSSQALIALDAKIDIQLADFDRWFGGVVRLRSSTEHRRALGVRVLNDSEPVALPALLD